MGAWDIKTFDKLVEFPPKVKLTKGAAYPFLAMEQVIPGSRYLSSEYKRTWTGSGSKFENGDVLFARITPCLDNRKVAQAILSAPAFGSTEFFVFRAKPQECDRGYLYYLSTTDLLIQNAINSYVGASGRQRADDKFLRRIEFRCPDLEEQQKIAAILTAYDDLIENNRQRIALLEHMAEEIYREWFVRMRFPGHEHTPVHKGVPEGWNVEPIRELVSYYIGGGWGNGESSANYSEPGFVIRGTDIPKLRIGDVSTTPHRFHKPNNLAKRQLFDGDIVFEVSGGSKGQLLGRTIQISDSMLASFNEKVMCASFCKLIRPDTNKINSEFLSGFLNIYYKTGLVGTFQIQSTGISNYNFEAFLSGQTVLIPPKSLQNRYAEIARNTKAVIDNLSAQISKLSGTRDLLLNRLISGKLRVDDLDIQFPLSMQEPAT